MTAFEQEKEDAGKQKPKTDRPTPAKEQDPFATALDAFQVGILVTLKNTRDHIDLAVPRILTLTGEERGTLSGEATATRMLLMGFRGFLAPPTRDSKASPPDKQVEALNSMSMILELDTSNIPPSKRATYEAYVKQTWKEAKATLDETLEKPSVKELLKVNGPSPK